MLNREEILLSLQRALWGEVYPKIRMIVYDYQQKERDFLLRYYLDQEPTEDDYENLGIVIAEFISDFKFSEFNTIKEECVFSNLPIGELETLSGVVYARKE